MSLRRAALLTLSIGGLWLGSGSAWAGGGADFGAAPPHAAAMLATRASVNLCMPALIAWRPLARRAYGAAAPGSARAPTTMRSASRHCGRR